MDVRRKQGLSIGWNKAMMALLAFVVARLLLDPQREETCDDEQDKPKRPHGDHRP